MRLCPTSLLAAGLLLGAFCGLFQHWLYVQNFLSWNREDWTHAYFVPLLCLFLLWHDRAALAKAPARLFWPGVLPIALGIACYLFFQVGAIVNHMAQGFALILTLFGVLLFVGGPRLMRVLFIPVAYMGFAVAISEPIMDAFTLRLQLIASEGAWTALNLVGISADLDGNVLKITDGSGSVIPLNVAEQCSGMRMVIAFVALAAIVAVVGMKHWWQRAALMLVCVPVAVLMNVLRVAVLGGLVLVDPRLSAGQSHMLIGTLLLLPAFGLFMAVAWALNKVVQDEPEPPAPGAAGAQGGATGAVKAAKPTKTPLPTVWAFWKPSPFRPALLLSAAFLVPFGLMTSAAVALPVAVWAMRIHLKKLPIEPEGGRKVQAIPAETPSWKRVGPDIQESAEMVAELGTQNYLTRRYVQKNVPAGKRAHVVDLHMAYYTGMIDTIPHVPERCLVGGGWQITGGTVNVPLTLDRTTWRPDPARRGEPNAPLTHAMTATGAGNDGTLFSDMPGTPVRLPAGADKLMLRTTEFNNPKSGTKLFAGYFFVANGGVASSAPEVRLLAFDLYSDYAYYLKVQVSTSTAADAQELGEVAQSLIGELLPEIMRCVPDWGRVTAGEYPPDNPRAPGRRGAKSASGAGDGAAKTRESAPSEGKR